MTPTFLEACLADEVEAASHLIGLTVSPEWLRERSLMRLRLNHLRRDPAAQPWLLRALGTRQGRVMVGHVGFHAPPGSEYLREIAPGGVELGFTVFTPYRCQGYAAEACEALMTWACREHGVTRFVVSIRPDNEPSRRLAQRFEFERVGSHVDEEDGLEDIFVRQLSPCLGPSGS